MNRQELLQWVENNCREETLKASIKTFIGNSPFDALVEMTKSQWEKRFDDWGTFIYNELHPSKNQVFGC